MPLAARCISTCLRPDLRGLFEKRRGHFVQGLVLLLSREAELSPGSRPCRLCDSTSVFILIPPVQWKPSCPGGLLLAWNSGGGLC